MSDALNKAQELLNKQAIIKQVEKAVKEATELSMQSTMPCVVCGKTADSRGAHLINISKNAKLRVIIYGVCLACVETPNIEEIVADHIEAKLMLNDEN